MDETFVLVSSLIAVSDQLYNVTEQLHFITRYFVTKQVCGEGSSRVMLHAIARGSVGSNERYIKRPRS